jgi:hypothetical protein
MANLLRLDLDRIRANLSRAAGAPIADDDLYRELAGRGVWRHSDEWWGADAGAAARFAPGEILEQRNGQAPAAQQNAADDEPAAGDHVYGARCSKPGP